MNLQNIDQRNSSFEARFQKHSFSYESENKKQKGLFFYLPFRDGELTTNEFLKYLIDETVHYAISYKRRSGIFSEFGPSNMSFLMELRQEIKSLFVHTDKSGDFGELIIYLILRDFFNAPQVVNKLNLKTAGNMPYHGADGIHMQFENNNLLLYFAESKLKASKQTKLQIKDAITSAKDLLNNEQVPKQIIGKRDFEINLINTHFELPNITDAEKQKVLNFLNPLKMESNYCKYISVCLVGFNFDFYKNMQSTDDVEKLFLQSYENIINDSISIIEKNTQEQKMENKNLIFVILPFESIIEFRRKFLELL